LRLDIEQRSAPLLITAQASISWHLQAMGERQAYGTSLGCLSRRIFVMLFCLILSFVCIGRLGKWFLSWSLLDSLVGRDSLPTEACSGIECYEVFSCRGFSYTTEHIREPMSTISGAVLFPLGVMAALHGYRFELQVVAYYLAILTVVYIGCLIGDVLYYETCAAYPSNAIQQALLWPIAFPLRKAQQDELAQMKFFPIAAVDKITNNFATMALYLGTECVICAILVYTAYQACLLGLIMERGPIGLGVHYGLGQFDQILNHEAIQKRKVPKSKFVEDCQMPEYAADAEMPLAYHVSQNYGAFSGKSATLSERRGHVEEEMVEAKRELSNARQECENARDQAAHVKEDEQQVENEALQDFRANELNTERHQERRAEQLAEDAADEAQRTAEAEGMSPQATRVAMARAYQHTLSTYHREMLEMAKAQSLHQHYRHVEREQHYHDVEEDVTQKVQDAMSEVQKAELRVQQAQEAIQRQDLEGGEEHFVRQVATLPRQAIDLSSPVEFGTSPKSMASFVKYSPSSVPCPPPSMPLESFGNTILMPSMGPMPSMPISSNMGSMAPVQTLLNNAPSGQFGSMAPVQTLLGNAPSGQFGSMAPVQTLFSNAPSGQFGSMAPVQTLLNNAPSGQFGSMAPVQTLLSNAPSGKFGSMAPVQTLLSNAPSGQFHSTANFGISQPS